MEHMQLIGIEKDKVVLRHYTGRIVKASRSEISHYVRYYENDAPCCRLGWLGEPGPIEDMGIMIEAPDAAKAAVMAWLGHDMKQGQAKYSAELQAARQKDRAAEAARQAERSRHVQMYMAENPSVFTETPTWEEFKEKLVANKAAKYLRTIDAGGYNTCSKEIRFWYRVYTVQIGGLAVELAVAQCSGDD